MPWIITKDHISEPDEKGDVGVAGPRNVTPDELTRLRNGEGQPFRMFDDDGELYYEGRFIEGVDSCEFDPLDDFGLPNAGCTEIHFMDDAGNFRQI